MSTRQSPSIWEHSKAWGERVNRQQRAGLHTMQGQYHAPAQPDLKWQQQLEAAAASSGAANFKTSGLHLVDLRRVRAGGQRDEDVQVAQVEGRVALIPVRARVGHREGAR